jgi:hypothetical protein
MESQEFILIYVLVYDGSIKRSIGHPKSRWGISYELTKRWFLLCKKERFWSKCTRMRAE